MTFTKIAVAGVIVLLGVGCWLAASGFGAAREGLICLAALVLLVGGGNLLSGRSGPYGGRGAPSARDRAEPVPGPEVAPAPGDVAGDVAGAARSDERSP